MSAFEIRPIDPQGPYLRPFAELSRLAFKDNSPVTDEMVAVRRRSFGEAYLTGAFDADLLVGTFRSWGTHVTVPGPPLSSGEVPRAVPATAVSTVAVLPTHTRRGILTAQMRHHLDAAAAAGSAAAVLIASEAVIYGRYGFGAATESTSLELDLHQARMRPQVPDPGGVSYVTTEELRDLAPGIFDAARTPGEIDRPWWWWDAVVSAPTPGAPAQRQVNLLRRDAGGRPDGYLRYTFTEAWEHRVSRSSIHVKELLAATDDARTALWRYLFAVDTVATVTAHNRPVDEPLAAMLVDPRALHRTERSDLLWVRLLDPEALLTARGYEPGLRGDVVLEVDDPLGYAGGRFELTVDVEAGVCRRCTDRPAELVVPVDVLSGVCLGGGDLLADQQAGRIAERSAGAVRRLATLFRTTRAPFDGTWF